MTLASMTGFGQSDISGPDFQISFEIRTFNSRFLDINVRAPKELPSMEALVRQAVRDRIRRGRVEVAINLQTPANGAFQINHDAVQAYRGVAQALQQDFQIEGTLTLATLLQLPGVLEPASPSFTRDPENFQARVRAGLSDALAVAERMRLEEGRRLAVEDRKSVV